MHFRHRRRRLVDQRFMERTFKSEYSIFYWGSARQKGEKESSAYILCADRRVPRDQIILNLGIRLYSEEVDFNFITDVIGIAGLKGIPSPKYKGLNGAFLSM